MGSRQVAQIRPIDNGWLILVGEPMPHQPGALKDTTERSYPTAAEACQAAAELLEPTVPEIQAGLTS